MFTFDDRGSLVAGYFVVSVAPLRVFAPIVAFAARASAPVAASWLDQPSLALSVGVLAPASAGVLVVAGFALRVALPAVAGIAGHAARSRY